MNLAVAFYGGSGIGLLIGVLMGTTVTPTVSVIIGALASGLAVLLGLNDQYFNNAKAIRIGSFGFACVFGAYLGIYVRSHNLLSPDPPPEPTLADQKAEYLALGFSEREALDFIAFSEFGLRNPAWSVVGEARRGEASASLDAKRESSLLFGAEVDLDKCAELEGTRADFGLADVVNNFDIADGIWRTLAFAIRDEIGEPHGPALLLATRDAFCAGGGTGVTRVDDEDCKQLAEHASDDEDLMQQLVALDGAWRRLAAEVQALDMDEADKTKGLAVLRRGLCKEWA